MERKDVKYVWTANHEKAFCEIKELFLKEMILAYPDRNKDNILTTDASNYAILLQKNVQEIKKLFYACQEAQNVLN